MEKINIVLKTYRNITRDFIHFKDMFKLIKSNMQSIHEVNEEDTELWIKNLVDSKDLHVIVATQKGLVCGYLEYILFDEYNYICEIQIDKKFQGDGITFKSLIECLVMNLRDVNCNDYTCSINPKNEKSLGVFKYIGFENIDDKTYKIENQKLSKYVDLK